MIKTVKNQRKQRIFLYVFFALCFILGYSFVANDAFLYQQTVVKVVSVENIKYTQKTDPEYVQKITAKIMNHKEKGTLLTFENTYTASKIASEVYEKGDQIIVKLDSNASKDIHIITVKRDMYWFILGYILIFLLLVTTKRKGFFTIASIVMNLLIFFLLFTFWNRSDFFSFAWMVLALSFCIITLILTVGFHKKMLAALLSSLSCVAIMFVIYQITIYHNHEISYELMPDMVPTLPLKDIYRMSVMTGLLGAVMDVAITINASVAELLQLKKEQSLHDVIASIQEIGYDIMGTMVNILFFSYIGSSLPLFVLKIFHGYSMNGMFQNSIMFDAGRFLIGAIGIVLAIPISGVYAILFFYPKKQLKQAIKNALKNTLNRRNNQNKQ